MNFERSVTYNIIFAVDNVPLGQWLTAKKDGKLPDIMSETDDEWVRDVKNLVLHMICFQACDRYKIERVYENIQCMMQKIQGKVSTDHYAALCWMILLKFFFWKRK